jgi:hypothetical protein
MNLNASSMTGEINTDTSSGLISLTIAAKPPTYADVRLRIIPRINDITRVLGLSRRKKMTISIGTAMQIRMFSAKIIVLSPPS